MKKWMPLAAALSAVALLGAGCQSSQPVEDTTTPPTATSTEATTPETTGNVSLTEVTPMGNGTVLVRWATPDDVDQASLFRIAYGPTENPTIPGSRWYARTSNKLREATITGVPAGKQYFRVCEWNGGKCAQYSNQFEVEVK